MAICTDDATKYLRRLGYNVVRHPREGIQPLDLIGTQGGETKYLGSLSRLLTAPSGPLPAIKRNEVAANVQGQQSSKLSPAIGISLLKSVTAALGGTASVQIGFQQARSLQFVFSEVRTDSVAPVEIGNYLKHGTVDVDNLILEQYVLGNGRLYVISRTIKTHKFTVQAERDHRTAVGLDVPAIESVASGNLKVDTSAAAAGVVAYEGAKDLVFGFECIEIGVVDGQLSTVFVRAGAVAMGDAAASTQGAILGDGALLHLTGG